MSKKLMLKNVICSHPKLFVKDSYLGATPKYKCRFLIDKNEAGNAIHRMLCDEMNVISEENKLKELAPDRYAVSDGDLSDNSVNHGHWLVSSSNLDPVGVIDKDKSVVVADTNDNHPLFYGGARVNALVELYFFGKFGDRIVCKLLGIQFEEHGERLGIDDGNSLEEVVNFFQDSSGNEPKVIPSSTPARITKDIMDEDVPL